MHPKDVLTQSVFSAHCADPETHLFGLNEGALGFGALCHPIAGVDGTTQDKLNLLLNLPYPVGTVLQFCLYASPDIEPLLEDYQSLRGAVRNVLLREITEQRMQFLRAATARAIDSSSHLRLHDLQLAITVRLPETRRKPTDDEVTRANELRETFLQTLRAIGIAFAPLTASSYVRLMETILNHKPSASWRESADAYHDPTRLLCHQVLDSDNAIEIDENGLWLGEHTRVKLLHVKRYPEYAHYGLALKYVGDYISGARGIRENMLITANVLIIDHESRRAKMEMDQAWTTRNASGPFARFVPSWKARKEALDLAMRAVDDGDRLVRAYVGVAIFTSSEDSSQDALHRCEQRAMGAQANARAYFREMGYQLVPDQYFCGPLFFQLLPFAASGAVDRALTRYRTLPTRHVVPVLPVLGAWRGTGTPMLTFHSRDGQVMAVSPFDTGSNMNVTIAAQSGKGKSFLTNEMIQSILSMQGRVWVIDIGYSYRNLCRLMNGMYLQFSPGNDICLNPFSLVVDFTEESDVLAGIIQAMAAPNQTLDDFQLAGLKRVMSEIVEQHQQETTIDLLAAAFLRETDARLADIGHQLFPFTSAGEYGRYFNGKNNFDANNPFIVCELEELNGRKQLQRVVLLQLMYQIQQQMYRGDRAQQKMLIIDEAWSLLAQTDARDFIVGSFRRVRKFGGSTVVITQSVNDLWANTGAIAIVENCANVYLLGQKDESINLIQKEQRLGLGESGYSMLKTLHTVQGQYSEIMFITEGGIGIGRLVVSDFNKLLYSTRAEEVAQIEAAEKAGMSLVDAIKSIAGRRLRALSQSKAA